eukprot:3603775-Rhodomonas_salina.2
MADFSTWSANSRVGHTISATSDLRSMIRSRIGARPGEDRVEDRKGESERFAGAYSTRISNLSNGHCPTRRRRAIAAAARLCQYRTPHSQSVGPYLSPLRRSHRTWEQHSLPQYRTSPSRCVGQYAYPSRRAARMQAYWMGVGAVNETFRSASSNNG